jgi:hypothetical protein
MPDDIGNDRAAVQATALMLSLPGKVMVFSEIGW